MCQFQNLYYSGNEFVMRCKQCGNYQIGFTTIILCVSRFDFYAMKQMVYNRLEEEEDCMDDLVKSMVLPTPYLGINLLLSKHELERLSYMLEQSDIEEKTQSLISMFNQ